MQTLGRTGHVGGRVERQRRFDSAEHEIAAHAGGEVDHDVGARRADALDDLPVQRRIAAALARLRVPDVNVRDRSPGLGRLDRGRGDLLRGHRHAIAPAGSVADAGDGAGDEDLPVHRVHDNPTLWTM